MRKCLVAPDSFKGTMTAREVCREVEAAFAAAMPQCRVVSIPIADGGEGTLDSLAGALPESRPVRLKVTGPFPGETVEATYLVEGDTAFVEMAQCAGLALVEGRANPLKTTTHGVGELIAHAIQSGCQRIVLGLGGSCTNDGGVGMASALGFVFRDADGRAFAPVGGTLGAIASYDHLAAAARLAGVEVVAMCDVTAPMHGPQGAACVFAPQKGASADGVRFLDDGLRHLDGVIQRMQGLRVADVPGAGAAGAMGAAVVAFLGGRLQRGIETVLDAVDFDRHLEGADLVITGEGRLDSQSAAGKVVSGIVRRAKARRIPVLVLAGEVDLDGPALDALGVAAAFPINRKCEPFKTARLHARESLRATAEQVLRLWKTAQLQGQKK
ncbi:MAG: glycerate kinase [Kiritimatiellia bacterium]